MTCFKFEESEENSGYCECTLKWSEHLASAKTAFPEFECAPGEHKWRGGICAECALTVADVVSRIPENKTNYKRIVHLDNQ